MINIDRFWNGNIIGIFGALYQIIPAIYLNLLDRFSTTFQLLNMKKVGINNIIQSNTIIRYPNNITLGNNIWIGRGVMLSTEISSFTLSIGSDTVIATGCILDYSGTIEIGKNCLLSEDVVIKTHSHGLNPKSKAIPSSLKIEDNVWIGMRSVILHNVSKIGKNSIIGANSVVTKDVPENVIIGGNPAKIIRKL